MSRDRLNRFFDHAGPWVLAAALAYGPLTMGAVQSLDFLVLQTLAVLGLLLALVRLWTDRNHRLLWPPAAWAALAFAAYAVVRTLQADLSYPAERELARVLVYFALFFMVLDTVRRQESANLLVFTLVAVGTFAAGYAIFQFLTKSNSVWGHLRPETYVGRASGTYVCPNSFAGFVAVVLPLAVSLGMGGKTKPLGRIILLYGALVMLAGLGFSLSRGGWLAAGAALFSLAALHLWHRQHVKRTLVLLALLAAAAGLVAARSFTFRERIQSTIADYHQGSQLEIRLSLWQSALNMWSDHPWWGVGPAHFDYRFPAYREPSAQARPVHAHNDYLNTLADWGVTGAVLTLGACALTLAGGWRTLKYTSRGRSDLSSKASDRWSLTAGAIASLVAILVHSLVDFNMQIPANALAVISLMALIVSHQRFSSSAYWVRVSNPLRITVTVIFMAGSAWLLRDGWLTARESVHLSAAARVNVLVPERLESLEQAAAVRPDNFETLYTLGEHHRQLSWQGRDDYPAQAQQAIVWFDRAAQVNPFDPYNPARKAMCLDWLGRHGEAEPLYARALELDSNNHYLYILRGWHYLQTGDYPEARRWFYRSIQTWMWPNPLARQYFHDTERLLEEPPATNAPPRIGKPLPPTTPP